jgi:Phosphopantetheine attachment site
VTVTDSAGEFTLRIIWEKRGAVGLTESITAFVCTLYAHVLGRTGAQQEDDFFADLNGDSLAAAQVIVVLEDLFQVNVIESFFDDSRPATIAPILAEHVRGHAAAGRSWPDGSSLTDDALREEFARLREWLPPAAHPAVR